MIPTDERIHLRNDNSYMTRDKFFYFQNIGIELKEIKNISDLYSKYDTVIMHTENVQFYAIVTQEMSIYYGSCELSVQYIYPYIVFGP